MDGTDERNELGLDVRMQRLHAVMDALLEKPKAGPLWPQFLHILGVDHRSDALERFDEIVSQAIEGTIHGRDLRQAVIDFREEVDADSRKDGIRGYVEELDELNQERLQGRVSQEKMDEAASKAFDEMEKVDLSARELPLGLGALESLSYRPLFSGFQQSRTLRKKEEDPPPRGR